MTMLNITPHHATAAPAIRRGVSIFMARLGRLIGRWIAALIARHERQAELFALRRLNDRELKDIGLSRGEIDGGLAEAAKARIRMQQGERSQRNE